VDTKELETLNLLHYSPANENGGVLGPLFPVVHNHLLCLDHIEGEVAVLAPHGQISDLLPIRCLIIVGDQAYHCCVIGKLNDGVGEAPVLRIRLADVLLPTLTNWWWPIRKSRIQLQKEGFRPRVLSLVLNFEGIIVLNAEL
jgi:hypothetical protein